MLDDPHPIHKRDATREVQAVMNRLKAVFWEKRTTGVVIHVPDPKLGHQQYTERFIPQSVLDEIKRRIGDGSESEDEPVQLR
jgi:hypothetical protein